MTFLFSLLGGLRSLLAFFSKPAGIYIAAAIAACLGLWWFGHLKYAAGIAAAAAAAAARSAQVKAKQASSISDANERAAARQVDTDKKNTATQEAVTHVKDSAAAMPGANDVAIPADIADRLRDIK